MEKIILTRGDTLKLFFYRKDKNGDVIKTNPQAIYFTVKNSHYEKEPIFQKTIDDIDLDVETGKYSLYIEPEDTNNLVYGEYVYDVEVKDTIDGVEYVKTISKGIFEVTKEVTFATNEVEDGAGD